MSGVSVVLPRARMGLFSDPSTQIEIPHLTGLPLTVAYLGTTVQFAGDTFPTGFRGEGKSRSYALTARYMTAELDQLLDLTNLFDTAHQAADSRLLLRTHVGQIQGLDTSEAVQVFGCQPTPQMGRYYDLSFTAVVVEHTFAV